VEGFQLNPGFSVLVVWRQGLSRLFLGSRHVRQQYLAKGSGRPQATATEYYRTPPLFVHSSYNMLLLLAIEYLKHGDQCCLN
jgi:hypothetical protein